MDAKREQALVGLFVLIASGLLIVTLFLMSGGFARGDLNYRAYFKNAGGLAPGAEVHYAGGPPVGRVKKVEPDPQDPTRMLIEFTVGPDVPVKTDSVVIITSNSPLGDNFLGVLAGTNAAHRAKDGAILPSVEYTSLSDVFAQLGPLAPSAQDLIKNLNGRVTTLQTTLERINDVLNDQNRKNISGTLSNLNALLAEDRPRLRDALDHVNELSEKIKPLIDNVQTTSTDADKFIKNADATLAENREKLKESIDQLHQALVTANDVLDQIDNLTESNAENIDEIILNLRNVTENLNSFTETIKTRPSTLLRSTGPKEHKPGEDMPK